MLLLIKISLNFLSIKVLGEKPLQRVFKYFYYEIRDIIVVFLHMDKPDLVKLTQFSVFYKTLFKTYTHKLEESYLDYFKIYSDKYNN